MTSKLPSERRRQFCARCGQSMFEYFCSPDGHFGFVNDIPRATQGRGDEVLCRTCGARYRLLERLSEAGQPVERQ
jgi:hypothetical protein